MNMKKRQEWNFNIGRVMIPNSRYPQVPNEPRRFQQMSEDIRTFTLRQYSMPSISSFEDSSPSGAFPNIFSSQREDNEISSSSDTSPYSLIFSSFGFQHHAGTDRSAELKVLKHILRRENLLLLITAHADKLLEIDSLKGIKTLPAPKRLDILDLLTRIREATLNLVEAICQWRLTASSENEPEGPKPFIWKNSNYLLKVLSDLVRSKEVFYRITHASCAAHFLHLASKQRILWGTRSQYWSH